MALESVTTVPRQVLSDNPRRKRLLVQMQPESIDAANTGRVHIGFGAPATPTVGHSNQGIILIQSSALDEPSTTDPLDKRYKGSIWLVASATSSVVVEEETADAP